MVPQREKVTQHHILVVDDDRLVLATLAEGLRNAGYKVTGVTSGEDALGIVKRDAPDLALLDVRMPGMDGIELGRRLREQSGVPFLYLSAYGDQEFVTRAAEEGALGYLVKPLDIQQIVPSIEAALTRAQEIRQLRESEAQLNTALAGSREISMAVGLLMMRDRLNRDQAFDLLRANARSQRRAVLELARALLDSTENLNSVSMLKPGARRGKRVR
ncbi:MAG: response regulator [Betaproteobacteria bacterium]|nr:response regulator [Betaproteobacteria bacterium]